MRDAPHMLIKVRSEALLRAVRSIPFCTLKLASFGGMSCSGRIDPCHLPVMGKGTSTKVSDLFVVAGCRFCHDLLDMRDPRGVMLAEKYPHAWQHQILRALCHTQSLLIEEDIITVKKMELVTT